MAKTQNQNTQQAQPSAKPTLEELREAVRVASEKAAASKEVAAKDGATDEQKAAAVGDQELADLAAQNLSEAEAAAQSTADQAKLDEQARAQTELDATAQANAQAEAEAALEAAAEDDKRYVPVFRDEDGERIERNRLLRLVTTTGQNLRSLDGVLITPEPTCELNGFDVRAGDWYTVQYAAGLIAVDSTKKAK